MVGKKPKKEDFYWPLGLLSYTDEVRSSFPTEAELIGVITILWNHHERHLCNLFVQFLGTSNREYAEAIWQRQPTHQAKRNLLAMALEHAALTDEQRRLLEMVIDKTKTFADRRNDLMHGEYVVHSGTDQLFALVRSPNSTRPAKYQKNTEKDLLVAARELEILMGLTSALVVELFDKTMMEEMKRLAQSLREERQSLWPENPQTDSPPPSGRRKRASTRKPPPQS